MKQLSVVVICITPFDKRGDLDEATYRAQLRRLRDAGVSAYLGGSGSGEGYALNPEERDRVLAIGVEELKGKVPVRAMGCEPRLISEMVDFMKAAERAKVDAAQIFSMEIGHRIRPTPAELENYYRTVIESTSVPIYLSSHEASHYVLPLDLVERLVDLYPQIAGIAYGGTDTLYLADLMRRVGDRIEVHCAGPANGLNVLGLGGNGFMGGEGNISPVLVQSVINAYAAGDRDGVRDSFGKLMHLASIYVKYGGHAMRGVKPMMNALGLPGGHLRPPRVPLPAPEVEAMMREVIALDLPDVPKQPAGTATGPRA